MAPPVAPVALFVFNRPDLTARVFEVVRAAKPPLLFVSADGPRPNRPDDERLCRETREVVQSIDWPCEVHWNLREVNLGCGPAMSQGISWVFENVDRAVILEDDCVPDPTFFPFCDELLERYQDDARVMQIAGSNLNAPPAVFAGASYSFASFPLIWGWATWRRAWTHYDVEMGSWPTFRDSGMLAGLHARPNRRAQLRRQWNDIHAGNGTWDHQWQYTVMSQHGLSVYPSTNLVSNAGFRADATQTIGAGAMAEIPVRALDLPLVHPPLVAHNPRLERFIERLVLRAIGTAVTILRKVLPSHRARRALRRILLPTARHGPTPRAVDGLGRAAQEEGPIVSSRRRRQHVRAYRQRHRLAKRILLGPIAPLARKWAMSGASDARKAFVLRRLVVPPLGASAKSYEREVAPGFRYADNTGDLLGLFIYLFGIWEPNLSTFLQRRLAPGDTFIDVGANNGWFTAMGAHLVGPTGKVVGIEASPTIARRLQANLDRNSFENTRVLVAAAMAGPGLVDIVPGPDENTGSTHVSTSHSPAAVQVRGDALPVLLTDDEITTARVVKIDVEGAEFDVVAGLAHCIDRFPETCEFVIEVGPQRAESSEDVDRLITTFESAGFRPYALPNFYDVRSYMLEPVATALEKVSTRPKHQIDIVFSRFGGDTLTM